MANFQDIESSQTGKMVEYAIMILSGKWKWIIIGLLYKEGVLRYGEIKKSLQKPTDRVLSQQLRELDQDKLITRTSYNEVPPRVEYALTPKGEAMIPIITSMLEWGKEYECDIPTASSKKKTYW